MPRIRSIKPEFWKSEAIARLPINTRLVFIGLWSYVDDNGVGRDVEKLIQAELFPLEDDPHESLAMVRESLATLSRESRIVRYTVSGKPYLYVHNWDEHQRIDKPGRGRYPLPAEADPNSLPPLTCDDANPRESVARPSRESRETPAPGEGEKGRRGEGEKVLAADKPPTPNRGTRVPDTFPLSTELIAWGREHCPAVDGRAETENWLDWHKAKGDTAKDWVASWRTWMRRAQKDHERRPGPRASNGTPRSTTDERVAQALSLREKFEAKEAAEQQRRIG